MKKVFLLMISIVLIPISANAIPYWQFGEDITVSLVPGTGVPSLITGWGGLFKIENIPRKLTVYGFCVELDEWLSYADRVFDGDDDEAWAGGRNSNTGDILSNPTQWLYWRYLIGDKNYSDPQAVQLAIWYLEDEYYDKANTPDDWNKWYINKGGKKELADLALKYIKDAISSGSSFTSDYIVALDTFQYGKDNKIIQGQSYIYRVPEPGLLILLGIGITGVGILARRYRKI